MKTSVATAAAATAATASSPFLLTKWEPGQGPTQRWPAVNDSGWCCSPRHALWRWGRLQESCKQWLQQWLNTVKNKQWLRRARHHQQPSPWQPPRPHTAVLSECSPCKAVSGGRWLRRSCYCPESGSWRLYHQDVCGGLTMLMTGDYPATYTHGLG